MKKASASFAAEQRKKYIIFSSHCDLMGSLSSSLISKNNLIHIPPFKNKPPLSQPPFWQRLWGNSPVSLTPSSPHWCHSNSGVNRGYVPCQQKCEEVDASPDGFRLVTAGRETRLKNPTLALIVTSWTGSAGPLKQLRLSTSCKMTWMQSRNHTGWTRRQWEPWASSGTAMTCSGRQHV